MNPANNYGSPLSEKQKPLAHRPLAEDVLYSAQEDAAGEVVWKSRDHAHAQPELPIKRGANFATSDPLKASLLAMAVGAMLTLALQRGLARGKARN